MKSSWFALAALAGAGVTGGLAAVLGMAAVAGNLLAAPIALVLGATGYGLWQYADRQVAESVYEPVGGNPIDGSADDGPGTGSGTADGPDENGDVGWSSEDWHRNGRVSRGPAEGATADPEDPDTWPWADPFWHDDDTTVEDRGRMGTDGGARPSDAPGDDHSGRRGSNPPGSGDAWWRGDGRGPADGPDGAPDSDATEDGPADGADPDPEPGGSEDGGTPGAGQTDGEWDPWWRRMREERRGSTGTGAGDGDASTGRRTTPRGEDAHLSDREAYAVLGVDPGADAETVRRAYRERVKQAHPDTPGGSTEEFKRVHRAYDRLRDRL